MTEKEKMLAGMLYDPSDPELATLLVKARKLARQYNQIDEVLIMVAIHTLVNFVERILILPVLMCAP